LFGVDGEVSNDVYVFRTWCFVFVWPRGNNTANTSPTAELLETDYLVVGAGAGASGMVFVDDRRYDICTHRPPLSTRRTLEPRIVSLLCPATSRDLPVFLWCKLGAFGEREG
jgi:hypothetical protein